MNQPSKIFSLLIALTLICFTMAYAAGGDQSKLPTTTKKIVAPKTLTPLNPALPQGNQINQGTVTPDVPPRPDSNDVCPVGYHCQEPGICAQGHIGDMYRDCKIVRLDCAGYRSRRLYGSGTLYGVEKEFYDMCCKG